MTLLLGERRVNLCVKGRVYSHPKGIHLVHVALHLLLPGPFIERAHYTERTAVDLCLQGSLPRGASYSPNRRILSREISLTSLDRDHMKPYELIQTGQREAIFSPLGSPQWGNCEASYPFFRQSQKGYSRKLVYNFANLYMLEPELSAVPRPNRPR